MFKNKKCDHEYETYSYKTKTVQLIDGSTHTYANWKKKMCKKCNDVKVIKNTPLH